ncbi:MAG TPA: trigger factor [Caulobacteraceae bacterium]|nr:trigger factor [Caulobacteraceae bacterium]
MSMQIVQKSGEGLSRIYGVSISAQELGQKLDARIAEIAPRLNLKGFRPGKVPAAHVRRIYGRSLMGEVVEQTLSETSQKVLDDNQLRVASQPDLKPESDMDKVLAGQADLAYELAVEVMPEFEPIDAATLTLVRPVHEPTEQDVDAALADLAQQARTYAPRTGKTIKAKSGDQLVIDFLGRVDGEAFEGGKAEDARLVLGDGRFIPGFEEQLIGAAPGAELTIKVTFPADYPAGHLRDKDAEFEVIWRQVLADQAEGGLSPEDEGKSEDQIKAEYRKIAERRVRLGLVLAEIGRKHEITVNDDELAQAMRAEAMRYRGQEQQVFDQLRQSPNAQATLRAPVYEDKVVDLLFGLAQITDKAVSKEDLLKDDDLPEAYGAASDDAAKPEKAAKPAKTAGANAVSEPAAEAAQSEPVKPEPAKPAKAKKAEPAKAEAKPAKAEAKPAKTAPKAAKAEAAEVEPAAKAPTKAKAAKTKS